MTKGEHLNIDHIAPLSFDILNHVQQYPLPDEVGILSLLQDGELPWKDLPRIFFNNEPQEDQVYADFWKQVNMLEQHTLVRQERRSYVEPGGFGYRTFYHLTDEGRERLSSQETTE